MTSTSSEARWGERLLALALSAIVAHRLFLALSTDFVINDGGLFHAFIEAVARTFPGLPDTVSYNGLSIPFAYPPLVFWIGGLLTRLGADPLQIVHFLPIGMNLVYVLLFALLLRRNRASPLFVATALLFLCTNQRSFEWLVMGGGLSRGLGAIFLMLTLLAVRLPGPGERFALPVGRLILTGAAVAGAILSHLEWGITATAAFILSRVLASAGLRDFIRSSLISGTAALLLVLPWLIFVTYHHGLAPLQAASGASPWALSGYLEHARWLFAEGVLNLMIPVGLLLLVRGRDLFWPLFLLLCVLLTPRHASTPGTLALAVLAAHGTFWVGNQLLRIQRRPIALTIVGCMALILAAAHLNRNMIAKGALVRPLDADERQAMAWVKRNHPDQPFLVLTSMPWWYDRSAEWFPAVTGARSVNTLQGREWLPDRAYDRWYERDLAMKKSRNCDSLMERIAAFEPARFIWAQAWSRCFRSPAFRPVFRNERVQVFERVADVSRTPIDGSEGR